MIVLDTNVLAEALRPRPSGTVLRWLAAQTPADIFTTAVTVAEILYGIELLDSGKRRTRLATAVEQIFSEQFEGRILPFDEDAARQFADIVASREAAGRPISQFDAMIAAITRSQRALLATRNTPDFEKCGIRLVNPWPEKAR